MSDSPADPFAAPAGPPSVAAPVLAFVGFAVLVAGLFALPLNGYPDTLQDVGFSQTRQIVDSFGDRDPGRFYSSLAAFWWLWGAYVVVVLLVVLVGLAIARVAPVAVGIGLAVVSLVGGVLHGLAMQQSIDYAGLQRLLANDDRSFFDHPGAGVWVSLIGFVVVLAGGVVVAATGRR